jgi:hypothetical protein
MPVHDDTPSLALLTMNVVTVLYSEMSKDVKNTTWFKPEGQSCISN